MKSRFQLVILSITFLLFNVSCMDSQHRTALPHGAEQQLLDGTQIGTGLFPRFDADVKEEQVRTAEIDINLKSIVAIWRKNGTEESYVLVLSTEDQEHHTVIFYDINLDGQWDVKTTLSPRATFIWFNGKWIAAQKASIGIKSSVPTAVIDAKVYTFQDGRWVGPE